MNIKTLRFLAFAGIIVTLLLSIWYTIKTYNEGNTRYVYLIMAFGISILLSNSIIWPRRRKD